MMRVQSRGFLLVTTILVIAGLAMLTAVSLTRSATDLLMTNRFVAGQQAFSMAEAGVDAAIQEFSRGADAFVTNSDWTRDPNPSHENQGTPPCKDDLDPSCRLAIAMATGIVTVQVDGFAGLQPRITATGTAGTVTQTIRVVVGEPPEPPRFRFAGFGGDWLHIGNSPDGAIVVDSYDSQAAPYSAATAGMEGNIGTNDMGVTDGVPDDEPWDRDINIENAFTLNGELYVSQWTSDSEISFSGPGAKTKRPPVEGVPMTAASALRQPAGVLNLPEIAIPDDLQALCPANPEHPWVGDGDGIPNEPADTLTVSGDVCYAAISVGNEGTLVLEPGARLYLTDPVISLGIWSDPVYPDAQQARLVARGSNQIFAEGAIRAVSRAGFVNETQHPSDLQIRAENRGDENGRVESVIKQQELFYGAAYVRRGIFILKGYPDPGVPGGMTKGEFHGSFIAGDTLWLSPLGSEPLLVHYDKDLDELSLSGSQADESFTPDFRLLSWRQ